MKTIVTLLALTFFTTAAWADGPLVLKGRDAADIISTLKLAGVNMKTQDDYLLFNGQIDCVDFSGNNYEGANYLMANYNCRAPMALSGASAKIVYDTLAKYVGVDAAMGKYFIGVDSLVCVQNTYTHGQGTDEIFTCTLTGFIPKENH
ncbi:MAG: hypothetical protein ACXWP5_09540 [Bdellovibrionota bacterium]